MADKLSALHFLTRLDHKLRHMSVLGRKPSAVADIHTESICAVRSGSGHRPPRRGVNRGACGSGNIQSLVEFKQIIGRGTRLYEGKDYRALGEAADHVLLMTYEWGYTYGPPMAVAPLPQVRDVVEYAVTEIPASKINLGIPNYGYDWPLPYERGVTRAQTLGNVQAVQLAIARGAAIEFDETAQSPYFNYVEDGTEHEVWFEDARSIAAKLSLIPEYGLSGAGYWNLMRPFAQNWLVLDSLFHIQDPV